MPNQVTATGKSGGGQTITAKTISNVSEIHFDLNSGTLRVYTGGSDCGGTLALDIGLDSVTAVTCTVSGGTFSFTVS